MNQEWICFGVESASEKILESFNRPQGDMNKLKDVIAYLNYNNVETLAFYIIGFPDDTWGTIYDTYELAVKLRSVHAKFSVFSKCVFEDDVIDGKILTPDIFVPFENTTTIHEAKNLTKEELDYILFQLSVMYDIEVNGLKNAYNLHYKNQISYINKLNNYKKAYA